VVVSGSAWVCVVSLSHFSILFQFDYPYDLVVEVPPPPSDLLRARVCAWAFKLRVAIVSECAVTPSESARWCFVVVCGNATCTHAASSGAVDQQLDLEKTQRRKRTLRMSSSAVRCAFLRNIAFAFRLKSSRPPGYSRPMMIVLFHKSRTFGCIFFTVSSCSPPPPLPPRVPPSPSRTSEKSPALLTLLLEHMNRTRAPPSAGTRRAKMAMPYVRAVARQSRLSFLLSQQPMSTSPRYSMARLECSARGQSRGNEQS
jgi:hypothetical protein